MSQDLRHLAVTQWRARLRAARTRGGGTFIQPVMTLVSGTVAAQVITFAGRPALTRLFTPEEFGVLTLFTTLTVLFGVVGTGRFEDAMMLPFVLFADAAGQFLEGSSGLVNPRDFAATLRRLSGA